MTANVKVSVYDGEILLGTTDARVFSVERDGGTDLFPCEPVVIPVTCDGVAKRIVAALPPFGGRTLPQPFAVPPRVSAGNTIILDMRGKPLITASYA